MQVIRKLFSHYSYIKLHYFITIYNNLSSKIKD
jgi:hypothetical protein